LNSRAEARKREGEKAFQIQNPLKNYVENPAAKTYKLNLPRKRSKNRGSNFQQSRLRVDNEWERQARRAVDEAAGWRPKVPHVCLRQSRKKGEQKIEFKIEKKKNPSHLQRTKRSNWMIQTY
jgi:hypothetical protein